MNEHTTHKPGFSLVELVVVVVIIGIIASIAIPRISRGSAAANDAAAKGDLYVLRTAILHYAAEYGNTFPGPTGDDVAAQLTLYTNQAGQTLQTRSETYVYGPYLLRIPPCPIGYYPGSHLIGIDTTNSPPAAQPTGGAGWVYNPNTGEIIPNSVAWSQTQGDAEQPLGP